MRCLEIVGVVFGIGLIVAFFASGSPLVWVVIGVIIWLIIGYIIWWRLDYVSRDTKVALLALWWIGTIIFAAVLGYHWWVWTGNLSPCCSGQ